MKITIFNWRDMKHPQAGGSELYFHEMAKQWIKKGHEIRWVSSGFKGGKEEDIIEGIKVFRKGSQLGVYPQSARKYLKKLKDTDIIIDVENGIPFFTPLYSSKKKVLHIHHIHKDVWFKEKSFFMALIGWVLETKLMPLIYKNIPLITLSNSSSKEIKEYFPNSRAKVVNPGIKFYPLKKKFPLTKKPSILFLNRVKKYKGIITFLKAAKELKKTSLKIDFLVAGTGDYLKKAKKYAGKNGLKNVVFLGHVSEKKKIELLQKSWILVNPSFKEGWGIVNIEANYFGRPVIGSDVSGIKDSVINKKTGLLFPFGNYKKLAVKIEELIKNKKQFKEFSKNSKEWAKKFSWNKKAQEYLKFLEKIYSKKLVS